MLLVARDIFCALQPHQIVAFTVVVSCPDLSLHARQQFWIQFQQPPTL
jgi:hypothetical protein